MMWLICDTKVKYLFMMKSKIALEIGNLAILKNYKDK